MLDLYRLLLPAVVAVASAYCDPARGQAKPAGEQTVFTSPADVERALSTPVPEVQFNDTPLAEALKNLQERARVNMIVDWTVLTNNGIERDQPVTLHLRSVPLRVVLNEVLRQAGAEVDVDLGYRVRDGLVRVATQEKLHGEPVLLDEVRFRDVSLSKVIEFLRSADPSFQVVLAGDPSISPDDFIISELDLRKVSAAQVLEALAEVYRIKVSSTGDDPPVWTVRVLLDLSPSAEQTTSVFRLREAIDGVQKDMGLEDRVKARAAVLQLLEHALSMCASRGEASAVLQLHEATDTLLFRGTVEQMNILRNALTALCPAKKTPAPPPAETKKTPQPPA